jgi:hypothetical protein
MARKTRKTTKTTRGRNQDRKRVAGRGLRSSLRVEEDRQVCKGGEARGEEGRVQP